MKKERNGKDQQKGVENLFETNVQKTKNGYQMEFFVNCGTIKRPIGLPLQLKTEQEVVQKKELFKTILKEDFKICNECLGFGNVTELKKFVVDKSHPESCTCPRCKGMGIRIRK